MNTKKNNHTTNTENTSTKPRIAVVGYGNVGRYVLQTLAVTSDLEPAGVVRREATPLEEYPSLPVVDDIAKLGKVDVAILAVPSRLAPEYAVSILKQKIATVDSFDIHTQIVAVRKQLNEVAKEAQSVAIMSAGWDPGSDSIVRMLMQAMAPKGVTYTNFGPGMSMGHTVAAKAIPGVEEALSITVPQGTSLHRRMVYIKPKANVDTKDLEQRILTDDYFSHDDTHVIFTDNVQELIDMGHGVEMSRKGNSGLTHNQQFAFSMRINNPALTAQILVGAARAAMRQQRCGAFTLPEVPVIDLLPGDPETWIERLC